MRKYRQYCNWPVIVHIELSALLETCKVSRRAESVTSAVFHVVGN
jgi:hypothetical protein